MAQEEDSPPRDGADRVARTLGAFSAVTRGPGLLEAGGEPARISEPIPIYAIGEPRTDSTPENLLSRARQVGWRYLVFQGNDLSVADIKPGRSDRPELIRSRELVDQIVDSGKLAQETVPREAGYQIRLLDLSILGESVLWLVSKGANSPDRFFGLSPSAHELEPAQFLRRMSGMEQKKAAAFSATLGESGG
jgi:hypothetical protein